MINKLILKNSISLSSLFDDNSYIGMFKYTSRKKMKMPMLFDNRGQAEKRSLKFGCEGAHQTEKMDAMQYAQIQALKTIG